MSTIRIEVGRATVEAEAVEVRTAEGGARPSYSVPDLLNAVVRTLRAIGTDDAAEAIDLLTAEPGSELEHPGDTPGVIDGVRVPLEHAPGGYVHLSQDDLRRAAVVALADGAVSPVSTPELVPGSYVLINGRRHRVGALSPGEGTYDVRLYLLDR